MSMIIRILERETGSKTHTDLRQVIRSFVGSDLVEQEQLSTAGHTKAVTRTEDVTFVRETLQRRIP